MHLVDQVMIITRAGVTLYSQNVMDKFDSDMVGGFLALINNAIEMVRGESINRMVASDLQLVSVKSEEARLYFFGISKKGINPKKIENYLKELKKKFCLHFEKEIKTFRGNISSFKEIEKIINLKDDPKNFIGVELDSETSKSILRNL